MASTCGRIRSRRCACPRSSTCVPIRSRVADQIAMNYGQWRIDRVFLLVPAQEYVGKYISTFKEFPPSQKVGSFSLDQVLNSLTSALTAASDARCRRLTDRHADRPAACDRLLAHVTTSAAAVQRLLRTLPVSAAGRQPRQLPAALAGPRTGAAPTFTCSGPTRPYTEERTVLVAGCGTSQAAKHAARSPGGTRRRHRLQRHQRAQHREPQAQARSDQPRGAPAADRTGRRAGNDVRPDRVHGRAAPPRGPRCGAARAARRAEARRRDAPDGVRAVRTRRHLHAAGVLPPRRHRRGRRRDRGPDRRARGVARGASVGPAAARGARLPPGGGARRRAAASAGSCVLGAAVHGVHRRRRPRVRPLAPARALQSAVRRDGAAAAVEPHRRTRRRGAIRRGRAVSGHDADAQRDRVPPWPRRHR